jgi:N-acetylglutamate synthase-like GNAT family acetyltransferase
MTHVKRSDFSFGWATVIETNEILELIRRYERQSMNLRIMRDARLYVCRSQGEVAGWVGISTDHIKDYAEYFSLYVKPEYRGWGLGLSLELAVVSEAERCGHRFLHFRVDSKVEDRLTQSRFRSGHIALFEPAPEIKDLCTKCELYAKLCQKQTFMKIDVLKRKVQLQTDLQNFEVSRLGPTLGQVIAPSVHLQKGIEFKRM